MAALPLASLDERFHDAHERRHGFADHGATLEVVTLEVGGWLAERLPRERRGGTRASHGSAARGGVRRAERVSVWHSGRRLGAPSLRRERLAIGATVRGPAVVMDDGATLWVAPGWSARVHATGALVLTRGRRA